MANDRWFEMLECLQERILHADYDYADPPVIIDRQMRVHNLDWFGFTQAVARAVGCAVVYNGQTCTVVGNLPNVDAMVAVHADCYRTLTRKARNSAIAIAWQAGNVLPTERRPKRAERISLELVAWYVVGKFPDLRDYSFPADPVLLASHGGLRLGGILPAT